MTKHTSPQIIKELQEFLQDISNASIQSYLIKKTHNRKLLEKFTTHRFQITDNMAQEYREAFQTSMNNYGFSKDEAPKIKPFTDPSLLESEEYYFIEKKTLVELDGLIDDLKLHNDSSPIQELNNMEKAFIYCLEITINDNIIFAFGIVDNMYLQDEQKHILAEFKKERVDKVTKNLIQFSKSIDCIYVANTETFVILNSGNTSNMLSFSDLFKKKAKEIIQNEWTILDIPDESLEKITKNNTYNQTLIKLSKSGKINNNVEHYGKYNDFCLKHNDLDLEQLSIVQNKLIIQTSKDLQTAIHVSDNTLVDGVLEPDNFSLALKRKPIQKR